jgi:hypothetical protein
VACGEFRVALVRVDGVRGADHLRTPARKRRDRRRGGIDDRLGYTVSNGSEFWLELTGISADSFQDATPDSGPFDYAILAPGETHTVAYNSATLEGLCQLTWDALAPIGFTNTGVFVVSAAYWDADPFAGGVVVSEAPMQTAAYSATVSTVPEPGTLLLMGAVAGISALVRRRRRSSM